MGGVVLHHLVADPLPLADQAGAGPLVRTLTLQVVVLAAGQAELRLWALTAYR
jgi:hypothetical protein